MKLLPVTVVNMSAYHVQHGIMFVLSAIGRARRPNWLRHLRKHGVCGSLTSSAAVREVCTNLEGNRMNAKSC